MCSGPSNGLTVPVASTYPALRVLGSFWARIHTWVRARGGHGSHANEAEAVLITVLQQRAPEVGEHGDAVKGLALEVGRDIGLPPGELATLSRASALHDVGKIAIPDSILRKPTPLDEREWGFMRRHTVLGERIVAAAPSLASVGRLIRASHERWDGGGYPDGLAGQSIPLAARIIFACDAYDAITADRPYSPARGRDTALEELRRAAGSQFDPMVVRSVVRAVQSVVPDRLARPRPVVLTQ